MAKGKADPIRVWQALEPRSILPEQTRIDDLRLVGRETELGFLVGALERSRREPSTQLVTVVGTPGIGKTRLVYELFLHIDERPDPVRWRRGRSLAYGDGVAFWAVGEMVKAEAGILESDSVEATADKLEGFVYNESRCLVTDVRIHVVAMNAQGRPIAETLGWVYGDIAAGARGYFVLPLPEAPATGYRVDVVSFDEVSSAPSAPSQSP